MVEIKLDKDKFDSRVEQIIHSAIGRSYGLKNRCGGNDTKDEK
jgi:hypothetical protein